MKRHTLLGLPIDCLTLDETMIEIDRMIRSGGVHQHVVLNAAKVVQAQSDAELRTAIVDCDLINADGMSVVWAGKLLGVPIPERVAGIDLMERLLAHASRARWPVYFLGAKQPVVERVIDVETARHHGLVVAGYRNGYWTADEEAAVVKEVTSAAPTVLFVAMPSPRKEQFLATHRKSLRIPFVMGVGGSFDVVAGVTERAPQWMQQAGLEWLFRLLQEPRRLAWRYIVGNTRFAIILARDLVRHRLDVPPGS